MKRPEGFVPDAPATSSPASTTRRLPDVSRPTRAARTPNSLRTTGRTARSVPGSVTNDAVKEAARAERSAARARHRDELAEVRRFTRRSRRRRLTVTISALTIVALIAVVSVVTLSPLMSLTTIEVAGTSRLDPAVITSALDEHRGTPLALLDEGSIRDDLSPFALIRSFSTEVVPPHTLVVRIVERAPVGAVARGGGYDLLDAAAVVVESTADRPAGIPLIAVAVADPSEEAFQSVTAVLSALPAELAAGIDVIQATTRDDVSFTMLVTGHRVVWGSGERSDFKARVLAAAIAATDQSVAWEYDVSAPDSLVVRRA